MITALIPAPSCACPVHHCPLIPVGGGARGICESGGETRQIETPEVAA